MGIRRLKIPRTQPLKELVFPGSGLFLVSLIMAARKNTFISTLK